MKRGSAREVLTRVRADLSSRSLWTQGRYGGAGLTAPRDASMAMRVVLGNFDDEDQHPATKILREVTPKRFERLSDFNDQATHAEVMQLFEKAIRRASR